MVNRNRIVQLIMMLVLLSSCSPSDSSGTTGSSDSDFPIWDGNSITYSSEHISTFGSATPSGVANYDSVNDTVIIWNTDASLDNYGGVQTPVLSFDFSKSVIFEMEVISCYSQYVIKLAVEGVNETFYVLADSGDTGLISVNIVDSMLSEKFSSRRTSPDPGYQNGWWYDGMNKKCSLHILAKGPDGESQTAELVLDHISIYNNMPAVTGVEVTGSGVANNMISRLKGSQDVQLTGTVLPTSTSEQSLIWSSLDENIASVSENGLLSFLNVGRTKIVAKSKIDQSKYREIAVDVLSGYENTVALKSELTNLTYGGSSADVSKFNDLFATTWGSNIQQNTSSEAMSALDEHRFENIRVFENYFDETNSVHVSEAAAHRINDDAQFNLYLSGVSSATIYRLIDGALYQESYSSAVKVKYAFYAGKWSHFDRYSEKTIVVSSTGEVYKYELDIIPSTLINNYYPNDFTDTDEWLIPDRSKRAEDSIAHALSPASLRISGDVVYLKQNKYPENKYCFGGIVSKMMSVESNQSMTMLLDVASLNQKSDYVKTMWEVKIIYYLTENSVVNSNPLKVMAGNTIGFHEFTFKPAYRFFRIYLVANGSDIGEQFPDAEVGLRSFKMYGLR
ncbi:MAG: Ig-like domain-containing protein [Bacilli bacterium]|nr:Ig-like domain-containing protein [Bacilli bacterium]